MPRNPPLNPESPVYARQHLERDEMRVLAAWLDFRRLLWCHVPNESQAPVQYRAMMAKCGVKAGVPDVLIFTPPKPVPSHDPETGREEWSIPIGTALELKAGKGRASPAQKAWLDGLERCGWLCSVQVGSANAIAWLTSLGY